MQKKIALFVVSVHILVIFLFCFSPIKKPISPKKHIAVRTIVPRTSPVPRTHPVGGSSSAPAPKVIKKASPVIAKPAPVKSKPIQQKKPAMVEKGKPPKAPDKVWKEIDEALAKIDDKVYSKPQSKLDVPKVKGSPPSQTPFPDFDEGESSEEETLASFLHTSLNLPEFGEVKIQMTIKKDGTVARLSVLQAESQKNKAYLEKHLPHLRFPLIVDKEKTFTFIFSNEI